MYSRMGYRTIKVGNEKLIFFFAYPASAGHAYKIIEKQGFSKIVVKKMENLESLIT